jgi:hypothetical protein
LASLGDWKFGLGTINQIDLPDMQSEKEFCRFKTNYPYITQRMLSMKNLIKLEEFPISAVESTCSPGWIMLVVVRLLFLAPDRVC